MGDWYGEMVTMSIPSEDIKKYYDENRCREHIPEEMNKEEMER